ncbi:MAG: substrate-binding domain-containing protein [Clostridia bacterium]|nr:substrate-binding domain-containing protein [Clostridia bacterium]
MKKRKKYLISWLCCILAAGIAFVVPFSIEKYEESITIDVTPNINVNEYLPFVEDSKIFKFDSQTFKLTGDLPIIDGATAAFPVYSAFVNAVYPKTTKLHDGVFEYNNTVGGYRALAEKKTDIFLGAAPSKKQVEYAEKCGTVFKYTQIGTEAFVFFVHKDNPIDSLTVEQIKRIYSGQIKNWSEVGGADEDIVAFQRNEGSGSQSMLIRFMGDTPIMDPETKEIQGMSGIIEEVVDYQSKFGSIGFSFRYYVEGIIKNPDIKMIAIDGVAPTVENIKNNSYPIVTPVYAVTYENNPNTNVNVLIKWILSKEGQYIIEQTGYVGIKK